MVKLGKSSKRTPVRLRNKIEKASAAKQRKERKLAKNNPQWRSKLKKDPGIPNLFPYKDRLLQEIEEKRRLKAEEAQKIREEAKLRRQAQSTEEAADVEISENADLIDDEDDELVDDDEDMEIEGEESNPMAALLASAKARAAEFADQNDDDAMVDDEEDGGVTFVDSAVPTTKESSRRAFDKAFKEVIDRADVVLYVLDARDPEGTRSKEVEREIMAAAHGSKRLILILNKIDLVPPPVLKGWLVYLRRYFPTLPLRASTGAPNAHCFDHKQLTVKGTSETLFKALKTYAHNKQLKRAVSVGVIGYPNVGKSSVINSLTSRITRGNANVCPVGAEAGVTTSLREVKLDSKLKIIDSPGIVFPNAEKSKSSESRKINEQARLILLNAIPPKQISDPVPAVTLLLKRLSSSEALLSKMLAFYGIPPLFPTNGDKTTDFLVQVARRRGRLGRGGAPNISSAATTVITDWRDGRIQGWLEAPTLPVSTAVESNTATEGEASGQAADTKQIVTEWAKEFKLEGLWGDDAAQEEDDEQMKE
ncbi:nuclear GTP-binding protein NUG1 [Arthroderma uncinatum]|uniref:nuclear GTP-binding protein NUG1 n=1 Tax=Arthroderma uncinatum TaxID=74035 RepID=UPI00144AECBF|nr:nuclear GTP-binding protein NUG1 [Arthroderma uncinatum]KAF3483234.1 nuclear GTP-binding protein NUG1 [Arthroderma uncinatum]